MRQRVPEGSAGAQRLRLHDVGHPHADPLAVPKVFYDPLAEVADAQDYLVHSVTLDPLDLPQQDWLVRHWDHGFGNGIGKGT